MILNTGWELYEERESFNLTFKPINSNESEDPTTTIYLTISSYRDKLCPVTLFNLFTKATYPNRIAVGV